MSEQTKPDGDNYHPTGSVSFWYTSKKGTQFQVELTFSGWDDFINMCDFAAQKGMKVSERQIKAMDFYQTSNGKEGKPGCKHHGYGPWVKRNNGHGDHKYYCAKRLGNGRYCGESIS